MRDDRTPIADLVEHFKSILTQSNECTADPIFVLEEKVRIDGMDPEYSDQAVWRQPEADYMEASERESELLYDIDDNFWDDKYMERLLEDDKEEFVDDEGLLLLPSEWELCHYVEKWIPRQVFFTLAGAQKHQKRMAHNYKETRIFVDSLCRNHEMRMVRELLKSIAGLNAYDAYAIEQHLSGVSSSNMVHRDYHNNVVWGLQSKIKGLEEDIAMLLGPGQ